MFVYLFIIIIFFFLLC